MSLVERVRKVRVELEERLRKVRIALESWDRGVVLG